MTSDIFGAKCDERHLRSGTGASLKRGTPAFKAGIVRSCSVAAASMPAQENAARSDRAGIKALRLLCRQEPFGIPAANHLVTGEPLRIRCYAFPHIDQLRVLVHQPVHRLIRKELRDVIRIESQAQYSSFHPTAQALW